MLRSESWRRDVYRHQDELSPQNGPTPCCRALALWSPRGMRWIWRHKLFAPECVLGLAHHPN